MTAHPIVGEIVAITTTDSEPLLLVSCSTDEHVTGVLLADHATETLQRLRASDYETPTRRQLAQAIGRTDDLMSFTVPATDCALVERDSSRPDSFEGGDANGPRRPLAGHCDRHSDHRNRSVATSLHGRRPRTLH